MDSEKNRLDLLFLLKAAVVWLIAALALLLLSSAVISAMNLSSSSVAYFSAGVSFFSAFAASFTAATGKNGRLKYGLLTGLVLTVLLIMLGFIVEGRELSADGVLSVVSFTLTGALVGGIFAPANKSGKGKSIIKLKRGKL